MADKLLQLVVQIVICLALLWLVKGVAASFNIGYIAAAYILSYILTKLGFYFLKSRKTGGNETGK